jgi:hypothetical protein
MDPNPSKPAASDDDEPVSLKRFFLTAVLWLPLAFFLWFMMATLVITPVVRVAGWVLSDWMPDLIHHVEQNREAQSGVGAMIVWTRLSADVADPSGSGGAGLLTSDYNPLLYCYGLPVLLALVMATPLTWGLTLRQLLLGYLFLLPAQVFGVVGDVLRDLSYNYGDQATAMVAAHGLSQYAIAVWYQFGYLMLPAVSPVVLWIVFNRRFIQGLSEQWMPAAETPPPDSGHTNGVRRPDPS